MAYHHGDLENRLIEKAIELLEVDGLDKLSMRSLAKAVGVSAPALYHHFDNRNALLVDMAMRGFSLLKQSLLDAINHDDNPDEKMKKVGVKMALFARQHPSLYHLMLGKRDIKSAFDEEIHYDGIREVYTVIFNLSQERINYHGLSSSAEELCLTTWCAIEGLAHTLTDARNAGLVPRVLGKEEAMTEENAIAISEKVMDVFVGRL